jgi:hypothetical protein
VDASAGKVRPGDILIVEVFYANLDGSVARVTPLRRFHFWAEAATIAVQYRHLPPGQRPARRLPEALREFGLSERAVLRKMTDHGPWVQWQPCPGVDDWPLSRWPFVFTNVVGEPVAVVVYNFREHKWESTPPSGSVDPLQLSDRFLRSRVIAGLFDQQLDRCGVRPVGPAEEVCINRTTVTFQVTLKRRTAASGFYRRPAGPWEVVAIYENELNPARLAQWLDRVVPFNVIEDDWDCTRLQQLRRVAQNFCTHCVRGSGEFEQLGIVNDVEWRLFYDRREAPVAIRLWPQDKGGAP